MIVSGEVFSTKKSNFWSLISRSWVQQLRRFFWEKNIKLSNFSKNCEKKLGFRKQISTCTAEHFNLGKFLVFSRENIITLSPFGFWATSFLEFYPKLICFCADEQFVENIISQELLGIFNLELWTEICWLEKLKLRSVCPDQHFGVK